MKRNLLGFIGLLLVSTRLWGQELRSGDLILIELNCWSCALIEEETQSEFSHSGLLLKNPAGEWRVLESLGEVRDVSLQSFLARVRDQDSVLLRRSHESFFFDGEQAWENYEREWKGLPFDSAFLWNNFNDQGDELLYCSEFIAKFLDQYMIMPGTPTPMTYHRNRDAWVRYFGSLPPEGELGNSPASFERDPRWFDLFRGARRAFGH